MEDAPRQSIDSAIKAAPRLGPSDDLEVYVKNLEIHLRERKVPDQLWKTCMKSNLTGKWAEAVKSLFSKVDESFESMKARLMSAAGYTSREAVMVGVYW